MQDMIILDLESQDREGVLKEMVDYLKKRDQITKEKELYERLLQREQLGSTAIGDGVAIPHCKLKGTNRSRFPFPGRESLTCLFFSGFLS